MNIEVEVLKEMYVDSVNNLNGISFFRRVKNEVRQELEKTLFKGIMNNEADEKKIFDEVIKGETLQNFIEKYGHILKDNVNMVAGQVMKASQTKPIESKVPDAMNETYEYVYWMIRIDVIEQKLEKYGIRPHPDADGKIVFITK